MASIDEKQYHGWAVIPKLNLHTAEVQAIAPISLPEHIFNNTAQYIAAVLAGVFTAADHDGQCRVLHHLFQGRP